MQRYVSQPLPLPRPDPPFKRADLELLGVQKQGGSFVLEIFLGNPQADEHSAHEITTGWAGTMPVFAHGACWGGYGHCDTPTGPQNPFDRRLPHPLTPVNLSMEVTAALRFLGDPEEVVVTILAREAQPDTPEREQILRFRTLTLALYD